MCFICCDSFLPVESLKQVIWADSKSFFILVSSLSRTRQKHKYSYMNTTLYSAIGIVTFLIIFHTYLLRESTKCYVLIVAIYEMCWHEFTTMFCLFLVNSLLHTQELVIFIKVPSCLLIYVFSVFLTDGLQSSATVNPVTLSESCWLSSLRHNNETEIHLETLCKQKGWRESTSLSYKSYLQLSQPTCVIFYCCSFNWITSYLCIIYNSIAFGIWY